MLDVSILEIRLKNPSLEQVVIKKIFCVTVKELGGAVNEVCGMESFFLIHLRVWFHQHVAEVHDAAQRCHHIMRDRSYQHLDRTTVLLFTLQSLLRCNVLESEKLTHFAFKEHLLALDNECTVSFIAIKVQFSILYTTEERFYTAKFSSKKR